MKFITTFIFENVLYCKKKWNVVYKMIVFQALNVKVILLYGNLLMAYKI